MSWFTIHEPPRLYPDWFDKIRPFFMENLNILLDISFHKREVEKLEGSS